MPQSPLNFGIESSGDESFSGGGEAAFNMLVDGKGALRRRPGLATYDQAPSSAISSYAISGIHVDLDGRIFAIDNQPGRRRIWRISGGSALNLSTPPGSDLTGTSRPTFAETGALLVIAGGQDLQKLTLTDIATPSARLGGSPPYATHVAYQAFSLITNRTQDPLGTVHYSSPGTSSAITSFETWSGTRDSGTIDVGASPDAIRAVVSSLDEVWAFGGKTVQILAPDPNFGFSSVRAMSYGIASPHLYVEVEGRMAWMTERKKIVLGTSGGVEVISGTIQKSLDAIDITGAFAYRYDSDQFQALLFCFPASGTTFCYQSGSGWSRWGGYTSLWQPFPVNCVAFREVDKTHVVGTTDGKVIRLTQSSQTDLGSPIRAYCMTGYASYATDLRKECKCIRLAMRKSTHTDSKVRVGTLRYRDEDGIWRHDIPIEFSGKQSVVELYSLGTYRRRQWEIEITSTDEVVINGATEIYEVLG